ncbi:MAG: hypothetical protein AAF581_21180 [Planctomycetota bacterium]
MRLSPPSVSIYGLLTVYCRPALAVVVIVLADWMAPGVLRAQSDETARANYSKIFDTHWQRLKDDYPYFKLYGVDWDAERAEHRPRALAAKSATEFAWEMAKLISALPDPHVSFVPSPKLMEGYWSYPKVKTKRVER